MHITESKGFQLVLSKIKKTRDPLFHFTLLINNLNKLGFRLVLKYVVYDNRFDCGYDQNYSMDTNHRIGIIDYAFYDMTGSRVSDMLSEHIRKIMKEIELEIVHDGFCTAGGIRRMPDSSYFIHKLPHTFDEEEDNEYIIPIPIITIKKKYTRWWKTRDGWSEINPWDIVPMITSIQREYND